MNEKIGESESERSNMTDEHQGMDQDRVAGETPIANETPMNVMERLAVEEKVIEALRTCYDPEIPVNIYELGLIYEVKINPSGEVDIKMTLTTPNCPVAGSLPRDVESKAKAVPRVTDARVELVWEPPWNPAKMSEAARLHLGLT